MILARHTGRIVCVGFGSIGQGVLPLILRHIAIDRTDVTIVTASGRDAEIASRHGAKVVMTPVTKANHSELLGSLLRSGDLLLNLAVHVSTADLVELCRRIGVLYLDTSIEPWPDTHTVPWSQPTNFFLRERLLAIGSNRSGPTALVAHGANPGLVSHFVKHGLLRLARDIKGWRVAPCSQPEWAALVRVLGVKAIHVTERDTQKAVCSRAAGEFVNTWSPEGLIAEVCQPAEFAWGTHERKLPLDGCRLGHGGGSVALGSPGGTTIMRSWTPSGGTYHGLLLSHVEALSIADFCSLGPHDRIEWRPTVKFVYQPCADALTSILEFGRAGWKTPTLMRVLRDEIVEGSDELGVLLMGVPGRAFWFGSNLTAVAARRLASPNSGTTLQVAAGILGGLVWALENPDSGLVEPEDIDHKRVLVVARPYLGDLRSIYTDWSPCNGLAGISPRATDGFCPWQFENFRVRRRNSASIPD